MWEQSVRSEPGRIVASRCSCAFHHLAHDIYSGRCDHSFSTIQHHEARNDIGGKGAPLYKVGHGKTPTSPTFAVFCRFQANPKPNIGIILL